MVSVAKFDQWQSTAGVTRNAVLQVVNYNLTSYAVSSSSSTYADTGLTVSITPSATTSKILVLVSINGIYNASGANSTAIRLMRNATALTEIESVAGYMPGVTEKGVGGSSISYLDSPSTTSSTAYKIQIASTYATGTVYFNATGSGKNCTSSITVMEIAG